jgi:Galactose oxidase, central domain/Kelch motif
MIRARPLLITLIAISSVIAASAFHSPSMNRAPIGAVALATPMLEPRSGHTATLLPDGKVLIAGGMRRNQDFYKSAELYDPSTGKFQPAGEMSERRVGQVAVLLRSGKVLIAGGWVGHGCIDSAELYDPANGKFTPIVAKMTTRRGDARASLLANGDVLITGGADHDAPGGVASAEVFLVADMRFHSVRPMHFARVSHTATLLRDGRILIVGGRGDRVNAVAELYDPKTGNFTDTGSLSTPRYKHTAGLLPDGRVLVAGGSDERDWSGNLTSAEIYDPKTGKFGAVSSMRDSRFKLPEEAVALESGKLLIAGGSKTVEVFDPATSRFAVASGEISGPWHFMTETKLTDGRILLAGGYANNDQATAQTWIYKPE